MLASITYTWELYWLWYKGLVRTCSRMWNGVQVVSVMLLWWLGMCVCVCARGGVLFPVLFARPLLFSFIWFLSILCCHRRVGMSLVEYTAMSIVLWWLMWEFFLDVAAGFFTLKEVLVSRCLVFCLLLWGDSFVVFCTIHRCSQKSVQVPFCCWIPFFCVCLCDGEDSSCRYPVAPSCSQLIV